MTMAQSNVISTNGLNGRNMHTKPKAIPVIDFADFEPSSSPAQRLKIAQELVAACRMVGFAYILNHGVPEDLVDEAFTLTKRLYDLPSEEKMKAPHPPGWAHHRGYSWPGLEKVSGALSERDDKNAVDKLREIVDCKVRWSTTPTRIYG